MKYATMKAHEGEFAVRLMCPGLSGLAERVLRLAEPDALEAGAGTRGTGCAGGERVRVEEGPRRLALA